MGTPCPACSYEGRPSLHYIEMAQKFLIPVMSCLLIRFLKSFTVESLHTRMHWPPPLQRRCSRRPSATILADGGRRLRQTWCFSELQATNLANAEGSSEAMILKQTGWCDFEPDTSKPKTWKHGRTDIAWHTPTESTALIFRIPTPSLSAYPPFAGALP